MIPRLNAIKDYVTNTIVPTAGETAMSAFMKGTDLTTGYYQDLPPRKEVLRHMAQGALSSVVINFIHYRSLRTAGLFTGAAALAAVIDALMTPLFKAILEDPSTHKLDFAKKSIKNVFVVIVTTHLMNSRTSMDFSYRGMAAAYLIYNALFCTEKDAVNSNESSAYLLF